MPATSTKTSRRPACRRPQDAAGGPPIEWDLARGELTGLVHPSGVPWDRPNTWWFDLLVTFEGHIGYHVDGMTMGVTVNRGQGRSAAVAKARQMLARLEAVSATVTHVSEPMDGETIAAIHEINAALRQRTAWRIKSLWMLCPAWRRGPNWAAWHPFDSAPDGLCVSSFHRVSPMWGGRTRMDVGKGLFDNDYERTRR